MENQKLRFAQLKFRQITVDNYIFEIDEEYSLGSSFAAINFQDRIGKSLIGKEIVEKDRFDQLTTYRVIEQSLTATLKDAAEEKNQSKIVSFTKIVLADVDELQRQIKYNTQRRKGGWDNSEIWNLDTTICKFVIPRLEELAAFGSKWYENGELVSSETLYKEIIKGLELYLVVDDKLSREDNDTIENSLDLLRSNFKHLWI